MPVAPDPPTRPVPPPNLPTCIGKDAGCTLATDETGDFYMTQISLELAGAEIDKLVDTNESRTECMRSFYRQCCQTGLYLFANLAFIIDFWP